MILLVIMLIISLLAIIIKAAEAATGTQIAPSPIRPALDIAAVSFVPVALAVTGTLLLGPAPVLGIVMLVSSAVSAIFTIVYYLNTPSSVPANSPIEMESTN